MKPTFCLVVVLLVSVSNCDDHKKKMGDYDGITPDILSKVPATIVNIQYGNKTLNLGQELTPTEVKDEPRISWPSNPQHYYTLIMFDPDAPSRENATFADVKHWLVVNILGDNLSTGEVIAEYVGSGPPKGTGLHRYIFVVHRQQDKIKFEEPKSAKYSREHRLKWQTKAFVDKYQLGEAVAWNYYKAQWDPYVEERNAQIQKAQSST